MTALELLEWTIARRYSGRIINCKGEKIKILSCFILSNSNIVYFALEGEKELLLDLNEKLPEILE